MSISPAGSTRRKGAVNSELLPAPVLPTIPTLNKDNYSYWKYMLVLVVYQYM